MAAREGLEHVDLMRLTRVARRGLAHSAAKAAAKPREATISRRGAGTCFDFSRADPTTYVAGTEEGVLHKCSSAYSEQYLRTYHGHSGPVHRAVWSPFARDVFASASADWTTKLWFDAEENAALTLQSGRGVDVTDVAWSPSDATVLATSSLDGGLDVWDLAISTLRPAVSAATAGGSLACVAFSETSPVIVAGGRGDSSACTAWWARRTAPETRAEGSKPRSGEARHRGSFRSGFSVSYRSNLTRGRPDDGGWRKVSRDQASEEKT